MPMRRDVVIAAGPLQAGLNCLSQCLPSNEVLSNCGSNSACKVVSRFECLALHACLCAHLQGSGATLLPLANGEPARLGLV